ncbi:MAG: site-specific tyrosine recombinase XerD [Streptococcaceae bacterium]|nr:site-specific tyrosine recombinase XerD [Streptococcaceae bacterium]
MKLKNEISSFLAHKTFSENTKSNYGYDLQHFLTFFENKELTEERLQAYKQSLSELSYAAQKRRVSASNQYLKFLYQADKLEKYYQISPIDKPLEKSEQVKVNKTPEDFSRLYGPIKSPGQFLALVILEFGLTVAEIQGLKWENFNWIFKVLTVEKAGIKRVLPIHDKFAVRVQGITNADELFAKSRQFMYLELKKVTPFTAKELREQYILQQVQLGKTIYEVADSLGLSTRVTLEKYFQ